MRLALAAVLGLSLASCSAPAWLGAGLGFGAAALNLDTQLLQTYLDMRQPKQPETTNGIPQGQLVQHP